MSSQGRPRLLIFKTCMHVGRVGTATFRGTPSTHLYVRCKGRAVTRDSTIPEGSSRTVTSVGPPVSDTLLRLLNGHIVIYHRAKLRK